MSVPRHNNQGHHRWFGVRRAGPVLAAATWTLSLLALWQGLLVPHFPVDIEPPPTEVGTLVWPLDQPYPVLQFGDLESADWIVLGDSRVAVGFDIHVLREAGLGRPALMSRGGARLADLLERVKRFPARRIVVTISPLSVYGGAQFAGTPQRGIVPSWRETLDADLDRACRAAVARWVRSIEPKHWQQGWFARPEPSASNHLYRRQLSTNTAERRQALVELTAQLVEMQEQGYELACIRLPISDELRAIEDEFLAPENLRFVAERAGVPYLDLQPIHVTTIDGSHVVRSEAPAVSALVVRWLERQPSWGPSAHPPK